VLELASSEAPAPPPASLNWREIDAILAELALPGSFIRDVRQPRIRELVWELYLPRASWSAATTGRCWLLTSFHERYSRLHAVPSAPARPATTQRFVSFLRARVVGCRIQAAEQLPGNRIVRVQLSHGDEDLLLWWRLWGSASNCVVTDSDHVVLDALLRRPRRDEVSAGRFALPQAVPAGSEAYQVRKLPDGGTLNQRFAQLFTDAETADRQAQQLTNARRLHDAEESRLTRLIGRLRDEMSATSGHQRSSELGSLILSNLAAVEPGARSLTVTDHDSGGQIEIKLQPLLSGPHNAEQYFDRSKEQRRRYQTAAARLQEAEATRGGMRGNSSAGTSQRVSRPARRQGRPGGAGVNVRSGAFTILVGRSATESDLLLRNRARGSDYWLHCRDSPGGHVFVLAIRGKSVPLSTLLDAGNLAVFYSKVRSSGRADVYYTQVKHLRRVPGDPAGHVLPTHERNLDIRLDQARIQRLLASQDQS